MEITSYIDTGEIHLPRRITPEEYRSVLQFGRIKPSRTEDGRMHGYRLIASLEFVYGMDFRYVLLHLKAWSLASPLHG